jgi:hypothetical protein
MLRRAPLDGIEIGHVHALETKPFGVAARQRQRVARRNAFASHAFDRYVFISPSPARTNRKAVLKIHDAQYFETHAT